MQLHSSPDIKPGPLPVTVNPGRDSGGPFAVVEFDVFSHLNLESAADCDRLMIAAATAKKMLELSGHPHGYEPGAGPTGTRCTHCGQFEREDVHVDAPCPSTVDGGTPCTERGKHVFHYGPDQGDGVRRMWQDGDSDQAAAAILAESIASGQPVVVDEDEHDDPSCLCGHDVPDHIGEPADGACLVDGDCDCTGYRPFPRKAAVR